MKMSLLKDRIALLALGAAAMLCLALAPAAGAQVAKSATPEEGDTPLSIAGQTVSIDPRTGRLRQPTREDAQALSDLLLRKFDRQPQGLNVQEHPNGMVSVDLPDSFDEVLVLRMLPGGIPMVFCVQGYDMAEGIVHEHGASAAPSGASPSATVAAPAPKAPVAQPAKVSKPARPATAARAARAGKE
jgi:hypothetical protein